MKMEINGFTITQLNDGRYFFKNDQQNMQFIVDNLRDLKKALKECQKIESEYTH